MNQRPDSTNNGKSVDETTNPWLVQDTYAQQSRHVVSPAQQVRMIGREPRPQTTFQAGQSLGGLLSGSTGSTWPSSVLPDVTPLKDQMAQLQLGESHASLPRQTANTSLSSFIGTSGSTGTAQPLQQGLPESQSNPDIGTGPSRTVYLGNLPPEITAHELLNYVRSGIVESLRLVPSKNCAFVSFLDDKAAMLFHSDAVLKRLCINGHDINVGWGRQLPLDPLVESSVARYHATRNVYLGNLPFDTTEDQLTADLKDFGEIEAVKILSDKHIAFVHFTSIVSAIKCVQSLPLIGSYRERKVFFGKDRCAFITKTQQHNAAQYLGLNPNSEDLLQQVDRGKIASALVQQSNAAAMIATAAGGASNMGNRTIYLGNLHPDTTVEEVCNVVRGGILQDIHLIPEKHACFVTFVDPISAAQFFAMSTVHGLIIHNRKNKVGWGKHSGPLPNSLNLAVANGASRNIYIGGLDKIPEIAFTKHKLHEDFKRFGEIEQINFFEQRHCAFVNFTNISNAIKAIDGIRNNSDYDKCKVNFGKDRCGNAPRQYQSRTVAKQHRRVDSQSLESVQGRTAQSPDIIFPLYKAGQSPPPLRPVHQHSQFPQGTPNSISSVDSDVNDEDLAEYVTDGAGQTMPLGIIMGKPT